MYFERNNVFNFDLSYELINTGSEHQHFRQFILENAALDYFVSRHN